MKLTRYVAGSALALLVLWSSPAAADSIVNLSGKIHEAPGDTITFNFTVQTILMPLFVEDTFNGTVSLQDGRIGCHPCVTTYTNDSASFDFNESVVLAQFGSPTLYQLIGTEYGPFLIDPPSTAAVATPEPSTLLLLVPLLGLGFARASTALRRRAWRSLQSGRAN